MTRSIVCLALLLAACSPLEQTSRTSDPSLVRIAKFPPIPFSMKTAELRLVFLLNVRADGVIEEARLLTPTHFDRWDAEAVDSIKQWRYAPLTADSASRWIRTTVVVQVGEPVLRNLGVMSTASRVDGDRLYALLIQGARFDSLARSVSRDSSSPPSWFHRSLDIGCYPEQVRHAVMDLRARHFTPPLQLGNRFFIFYRYDDDDVREMDQ